MKDLLRTQDLSRDDIEMLLATATEFASNPLRSRDALAHKSVAIYMTKPSTRTRLASETAVAHLGGTPIFLRGDDLQLGRGETIADTARIISGYCDAMIVRTFAQSDVDELGAHASIPVINALTDVDHPTQLLADWLTIRENFGSDITGRKFVYLGDGNNMSHAWLIMGAIMGAHVVAATPEGSWSPDSMSGCLWVIPKQNAPRRSPRFHRMQSTATSWVLPPRIRFLCTACQLIEVKRLQQM